MKKQTFFLTFTFAAIVSAIFLSGCSKPVDPTYDETGYSGTYYGKHYLADSNSIRMIVGADATMIYDDTLIITNGADSTDGKVNAKSSLLGGGTIEINTIGGAATPVFLGNIDVLGTTLKNTKLTSGKGTWNGDKTQLTTHLVVNVTYDFNGTDIPLTGFKINGQFTKQ
ncbi:MAG: hypothetical protein IT271_10235 [Chitinophagales bacterium]|nr:hypothetical protein [Chitinophagales bacterium]